MPSPVFLCFFMDKRVRSSMRRRKNWTLEATKRAPIYEALRRFRKEKG